MQNTSYPGRINVWQGFYGKNALTSPPPFLNINMIKHGSLDKGIDIARAYTKKSKS